jgi:hypothetical protein
MSTTYVGRHRKPEPKPKAPSDFMAKLHRVLWGIKP